VSYWVPDWPPRARVAMSVARLRLARSRNRAFHVRRGQPKQTIVQKPTEKVAQRGAVHVREHHDPERIVREKAQLQRVAIPVTRMVHQLVPAIVRDEKTHSVRLVAQLRETRLLRSPLGEPSPSVALHRARVLACDDFPSFERSSLACAS